LLTSIGGLRRLQRGGKAWTLGIIRAAVATARHHPVIMIDARSRHWSTMLIAALALGACATQPQMVTDSPGLAAPASPQATLTETPSPPPPPPSAASPPPQPAGRAARAPTVPQAAPAGDGPMTVTRARELCWMLAERERARDIDTRVKFVERCVNDKMKQ
jgi:hypothetical protein